MKNMYDSLGGKTVEKQRDILVIKSESAENNISYKELISLLKDIIVEVRTMDINNY